VTCRTLWQSASQRLWLKCTYMCTFIYIYIYIHTVYVRVCLCVCVCACVCVLLCVYIYIIIGAPMYKYLNRLFHVCIPVNVFRICIYIFWGLHPFNVVIYPNSPNWMFHDPSQWLFVDTSDLGTSGILRLWYFSAHLNGTGLFTLWLFDIAMV